MCLVIVCLCGFPGGGSQRVLWLQYVKDQDLELMDEVSNLANSALNAHQQKAANAHNLFQQQGGPGGNNIDLNNSYKIYDSSEMQPLRGATTTGGGGGVDESTNARPPIQDYK